MLISSPFKAYEMQIQIFQDLPHSVLMKRKVLDFLRQIIPNKYIWYCWKIPFAFGILLPEGVEMIYMTDQRRPFAEETDLQDCSMEENKLDKVAACRKKPRKGKQVMKKGKKYIG